MKKIKVTQFASGLDHPEGLAFDREGNLWAGGEAGQLQASSGGVSVLGRDKRPSSRPSC